MVVADSWAEQRVLMRAFASCGDQTRPTIVLHGVELAIGPAGIDPHGNWGIHVEPPADGRAQDLRAQLELAARRLAGSKGNPPRLVDEMSRFDTKATQMWAPGTPADLPPPSATHHGYYEPAEVIARQESASSGFAMAVAAPVPRRIVAAVPAGATTQPALIENPDVPVLASAERATLFEPLGSALRQRSVDGPQAAPGGAGRGAPNPAFRAAAVAAAQAPMPFASDVGSRTQPGFLPPDPTPARTAMTGAMTRPGPTKPPPATSPPGAPGNFASLVGRTMPIGLQLTDEERDVLNALGRAPSLTAAEVGQIAHASDPVAWMESFLVKLAELGLDLIAPGDAASGGEPTYVLRR